MRLTIVNLLIQSGNEGERKHSATILARKLFELNPPYAGPAMRPMLHIGTRMRGSKMKPPLRRRGHNGAQTPSSFAGATIDRSDITPPFCDAARGRRR